MKKFLFRLETVLKIRKTKEGRIEREVAFALQKLSQWKEKESSIEKQIAALMEEVRKKREEGCRSLEETYTQLLDHLNLSLAQTKSSITAHEAQVTMQKERLKNALIERKIVEKIKEKHYAGWRSQIEQSDGAILDELSSRDHTGC